VPVEARRARESTERPLTSRACARSGVTATDGPTSQGVSNDAAGIRDFFSRNEHRFDYTLKPGEAFFLYLDRVNVAEAGWGYRERLDFRHYPMSSPGEYAISAAGRFFHAGPAITGRPFRVRVE
jgi:hypothetical protein